MTSGDLVVLGIENIQGDVLVTSSGLKKLSTDFGIKDKPMLGFALTAFFSFKVKSFKFDFRLLTLLFILGGKKALEPQHFFRPSSRGSAQFFFDPLKSKLKSSEFSVFCF